MRSRSSFSSSMTDLSASMDAKPVDDKPLSLHSDIKGLSTRNAFKFFIVIIILTLVSLAWHYMREGDGKTADIRDFERSILDHLKTNELPLSQDFNRTIHLFDITLLKTKLAGVSYEGGHWFHMAENFLTHHARQKSFNYDSLDAKPHAKIIRHLVYVFDDCKFDDLVV